MNITDLTQTIVGAKIFTFHMESAVRLNKGGRGKPENAMYGRVRKRKTISGYVYSSPQALRDNVNDRKKDAGESAWEPKQRAWGTRVANGPIIFHVKKDGEEKAYIEVEVIDEGDSTYYLDQKKIAKEDITGMPAYKERERKEGDIGDTEIRTIDLAGISSITIGEEEYIGPFTFTPSCPFCGSHKASMLIVDGENGDVHAMQCDDCGATGPENEVEEKARYAWKTRKA